MTRAALAALLLLFLPLAGCLGNDPDAPPTAPTPSTDADDVADGMPRVDTGTPLLGPPRDPWGDNVSELELFKGTVEVTGWCATPPVFDANWWGGCGYYALPPGSLIPEGTATLRIEADASAALRVGTWGPVVDRTRGSSWAYGNDTLVGAPTADATGVWRIALAPRDWDLPDFASSWSVLSVWSHGPDPNELQGPVDVRVVAERDPGWVALPRVDAWHPGGGYPSPQPGVVTLVDSNQSIAHGNLVADTTGAEGEVLVPFTHKVPAGTVEVAALMIWEIEGCASPDQCSARGGIRSGSRNTAIYSALVNEVGDGWRILTFAVPAHVAEDGPYVQSSLTRHSIWLDDCTPHGRTVANENCPFAQILGLKGEVRYVAEAWQGPVDLAALKARWGLS